MSISYPIKYSGEVTSKTRFLFNSSDTFVLVVELVSLYHDTKIKADTFWRVKYHDKQRKIVTVCYEGGRSGAYANGRNATRTLRKGGEPVISGRGIRSPLSKKSLGRKEYTRLRVSGELYDLREQHGLDISRSNASSRVQVEESDVIAMKQNPLYGMF